MSLPALKPVTGKAHRYEFDGRAVPGVTDIIPSPDFSFVSEAALKESAIIGTRNHAILEDELKGQAHYLADDRESNYLMSIDLFVREYAGELGEPVLVEEILYSERFGFAGKPDILYKNAIVDLKKSGGDHRIRALQCAGYHELGVECGRCDSNNRWLILVINDSGKGKPFSIRNVYNPYARGMFLSLVQKYNIEKQYQNYQSIPL